MVLCLSYLILLGVFWGGFLSFLDARTLQIVTEGHPWSWASLSYSIFISTGLMLLGQIGWAALVQVMLFIYLAFKVFSWIAVSSLSLKHKVLLGLFFCFLSVHPLNQVFLLYSARNSFFAILLMVLGLQFFNSSPMTYLKTFSLSLLVILLADLRSDAKIYLFLVPLLFWLLKKWNKDHLKIYMITVFTFGLGYLVGLPQWMDIQDDSDEYVLTTYVLPLSYILHEKGLESLSREQKENIDAVIPAENFITYFNPINIDPYYHRGMQEELDPVKFRNFRQTAHTLFIQNWKIILKSRLYMTKSMLNLGNEKPHFFIDMIRSGDIQKLFPEVDRKLQLSERFYETPTWARTYMYQLNEVMHVQTWWARLFNSYLLPLAFLIFSLLCFKKHPPLAAFAALIGVRLPVLFLLAPANYLQHNYALFLFFIFAVVLYFLSVNAPATTHPRK